MNKIKSIYLSILLIITSTIFGFAVIETYYGNTITMQNESIFAENVSSVIQPDNVIDNVPFAVISKQFGRVIGKDILSEVVLKAKFIDSSIYAQKITIDINDNEGKLIAQIHPETDGGYLPQIQLLPFDNSGIDRIFLGMGSGGSGGYGYNYVFSAENNRITTLFDYNAFNSESVFTATYTDCYKVIITSADNKITFVIDISKRSQDYLSQIYNKSGKLLKPKTGDVYAVSSVFPYFNTSLNVYQLAAYQSITGLYGADGLGNIVTRLLLKGNLFNTEFVSAEIYPVDIE